MTQRLFPSLLALALTACSGAPTPDPNPPVVDAGTKPKPTNFDVTVLDPTETERQPLAVAQRGDKLGVAYFNKVNATDYRIQYLEWQGGTVTNFPPVQTVQRPYGLSVAFAPDGRAAVAYLGGGADNSTFWFQSDAVVSFAEGDGGWTEEVAVTLPSQAGGSPTSTDGFVVGVNPALLFEGQTAQLAYRDVGGGQNPQDYLASDVELATRTGANAWTPRNVLTGETDQAYGGHLKMLQAGAELAIVCDRQAGTAEFSSSGADVIFTRRLADGGFTLPHKALTVGNTQQGPSLAYDAQVGFAIAAVDRTSNTLFFTSSNNGTTWLTPDPAYQSGTGGWWPSLSFDPSTHEPSIAFYQCGLATGLNEGTCVPDEDELRVLRRIGANWREALVDEAGGYLPQLFHLSDGKRVLVYRDPVTSAVKLAKEK